MLLALLLASQVAGMDTLATCRAPGDPQQRTWHLVRREGAYAIAYRARDLDRPQVELPLPGAAPAISGDQMVLAFKSANGGRTVTWRIGNEASTLDLYVNHGLEVNVDADLDPAVDLMNTDGPVSCAATGSGPISQEKSESVSEGNWSRPLSAEWNIAGGVARSVKLFQSTAGRSYAVQTIGWARELTHEWGPGALRGRFAWGVEAMPIFAQFSPSAIYGVGFAPVVWRWNFVPQPRWSGFAELSMGGMWSSEPIPERTGRANFTAHWGGGVRLRPRGSHSVLVGYRFQHFSNGNQFGSNPGVNAHVVLLGWSQRS
jgi:hypothetical protein